MLRLALSNWQLKLLALALAFGIWVSVTGETRVVQDFSIPLEVRLSEESVVASTLPNTVTVRLRGSESVMRRLDPVPMAARVDLRDAAQGERDVVVSEEDLRGVPRGVDVEFIDPDRLQLTLDSRMRRELTVEPVFLGQPPAGHVFYGARVRPERVLVEGPRGEVEGLEIARTNPIRLDRRTESFTARIAAAAEGEHVRMVDSRPVEVYVAVDTSPVERTLERINVHLRGQRYETSVTPTTTEVVLTGPSKLVASIQRNQLSAIADVEGLAPGARQRIPLTVQLIDVPIKDLSRLAIKSVRDGTVEVRVSSTVLPR